jgi:hypothetical protein
LQCDNINGYAVFTDIPVYVYERAATHAMSINWKLVLKIATGIVVVPITIVSTALWSWWQQASLPLQILSAPLVFPIAGFAYLTTFWWDEL